MNRLSVAAGLLLLGGLVLTASLSSAEDDKDLSIKEIMTKAHKGGDSLLAKLEKEMKGAEPEWATVQKQVKELVDLGTALGKATPPKGEKASWEKLTKAYQENAKHLEEAAEKKDKATVAADLKKVRGMCAKCHTAHKG